MNSKKISRKEFILKSSKCVGGIACFSVSSSIINSCSKPALINYITSSTEYISKCPCHGAEFDQNGEVMRHPNEEFIENLKTYNSIINNNELIIENNDESLTIILSDHPDLENIGGISSTESNNIDSQGILLFRKSESKIIALSRECTHNGCQISGFENI